MPLGALLLWYKESRSLEVYPNVYFEKWFRNAVGKGLTARASIPYPYFSFLVINFGRDMIELFSNSKENIISVINLVMDLF